MSTVQDDVALTSGAGVPVTASQPPLNELAVWSSVLDPEVGLKNAGPSWLLS